MKFFLDANMPISTLKVFEDLKLEAIHAKRIELNNAEDIELIAIIRLGRFRIRKL